MSFRSRFNGNFDALVDSPPAAWAIGRVGDQRAFTPDYDHAGLLVNVLSGLVVSSSVLALSGLGAALTAGVGITLPQRESLTDNEL